jgi:heptosyltransferase III
MAYSSSEPQRRVVIYRLGSLGDTVVALPCFHRVAQVWPDAERIVLTNFPVSSKAAPLEVILRESGLVHGAIAYPVGTRSVLKLWRLARDLRRLGADTLIYLTPARGLFNARRDWLFFKLCGFKEIVGTPLTHDLQHCRVNHAAAVSDEGVEERESERLARCLETLGPINLDDPAAWDLRLTAAELQAGRQMLGAIGAIPYFAINMGGKAREKDWGLANWQALLESLGRRHPKAGLLIVGAAEDSERARSISLPWPGPVVDACGKLSPRESAAAMRDAAVFIGHDSGPLHLAASTGVPCVGLFGSHNRPNRWHPQGSQHHIIHRMAGLQTITVPEVVQAVEDLLSLRQACA